MGLGGLGDAAKGATDKATKNVVGDTIDALAGDLAGRAGSNATGTPRFIKADPLPADAGSSGGAVQNAPAGEDGGRKKENALSLDPPIEFIHLSYVHPDLVKTFAGEAGSHGIAFRDALLRENILIWSFARSAQRVLEQVKASKGAAGAMLETAGSMLGGSKQASQGPEAIDPILDRIRAAGDKANSDSPAYTALHDAGKELAQAWADLNTACIDALRPEEGGGLGLPTLPGANLIPGAVPDVVARIPEWLFKVQDGYMAMFREARIAYEWPLMKAVHEYSVAAIKADWRPTYDIWFLRDAAADEGGGDGPASAPEQALQDAQDALNGLPSFGSFDPGGSAASPLGSVQEGITGARKDARDSLGDITGWLATAESEQADVPPEAAAALSACFAVFNGDPQANPPVRPLAEVLGDGLADGLGMKSLPGFLTFHLGITCDIALVVLPKIYSHLHGRLGKPDPSLFMAAVHDAIASRIVELVWGLIFGKQSKPGDNDADAHRSRGTDVVDGLGQGRANVGDALPSRGELENRAADMVQGFIKSQARYLNALYLFLALDLFQELAIAYADSAPRRQLTMEAYLGHLPRMAALLARNLTFPMFNLILEVFDMADTFAGMAWDPVSEKLDQAGRVASQVKGVKDDIGQAGEDVQRGAHRADEAIEQRKTALGDGVGDLVGGGTVNSIADVQQMASDKEAVANQLKDDVVSAPGDIWDAATKKEAEAAGIALPEDKGLGPISDRRRAGGAAAGIAPGEPGSAGYVNAEDEEEAVKGHQQAPPASPPAPGPESGDLPF